MNEYVKEIETALGNNLKKHISVCCWYYLFLGSIYYSTSSEIE